MKRLALSLLLVAGACTAQPRSASYIEVHPEQAEKVARDCARGLHRGRECEAAHATKSARETKARLELFRRGFK